MYICIKINKMDFNTQQQIKNLKVTQSVNVSGGFDEIQDFASKLPGNYTMVKVDFDEYCIIRTKDSTLNKTQRMNKAIENLPSIGLKRVNVDMTYLRVLVSKHNKKNDDVIKVIRKDEKNYIYRNIINCKDILSLDEMNEIKNALHSVLYPKYEAYINYTGDIDDNDLM